MDSSKPFDVQPLKTVSLAGAIACVILCFLVTEPLGVQIIPQPVWWKCSSMYQDCWLQMRETQAELSLSKNNNKNSSSNNKNEWYLLESYWCHCRNKAEKPIIRKPRVRVASELSGTGTKNLVPPGVCVFVSLSPSHFCMFLCVWFISPNVNQLLTHGWGSDLWQLQVHIFPTLLPKERTFFSI